MSRRRVKFTPTEEIQPWNENGPGPRIIANRYIRAGVHAFNNDRVYALAKNLNQTLWVICARAGMFKQVYDPFRDVLRLELDKPLIRRCIENNLWPVSAALHFELMEKAVAVKSGEGILVGTGNIIDAKILNNSLERKHG